ncbi:hypothetical protein Tco_0308699 [Tanacetum coccineum]
MSQPPNELGYFTHLLNSNPHQYSASLNQSNPSTPGSQNSNSSSQPVPQSKDPRDGRRKHKKTRKQPIVELDEDDDEEMASRRAVTRWNNNEEILLAETWIEHSQDANIRKDQQDDVYWNLITQDFNNRSTTPPRTKNMMTGKWTRMHGDCQRFHGIYKHLTRKSGESDALLDYRRKCDAAEIAYEAKREKEVAMMECRELEFLMLDPSSLPPEK